MQALQQFQCSSRSSIDTNIRSMPMRWKPTDTSKARKVDAEEVAVTMAVWAAPMVEAVAMRPALPSYAP
eukprot:5714165-Prymnesium_polylepis.1